MTYCSNVAPNAKKCSGVLKMENSAPKSKKSSKVAESNRERPMARASATAPSLTERKARSGRN